MCEDRRIKILLKVVQAGGFKGLGLLSDICSFDQDVKYGGFSIISAFFQCQYDLVGKLLTA